MKRFREVKIWASKLFNDFHFHSALNWLHSNPFIFTSNHHVLIRNWNGASHCQVSAYIFPWDSYSIVTSIIFSFYILVLLCYEPFYLCTKQLEQRQNQSHSNDFRNKCVVEKIEKLQKYLIYLIDFCNGTEKCIE